MMVAKRKSTRKPAPVAFCRIPVRSMFTLDGVKYLKFAPKKGMTPEGKVISLTDATLVHKA